MGSVHCLNPDLLAIWTGLQAGGHGLARQTESRRAGDNARLAQQVGGPSLSLLSL